MATPLKTPLKKAPVVASDSSDSEEEDSDSEEESSSEEETEEDIQKRLQQKEAERKAKAQQAAAAAAKWMAVCSLPVLSSDSFPSDHTHHNSFKKPLDQWKWQEDTRTGLHSCGSHYLV